MVESSRSINTIVVYDVNARNSRVRRTLKKYLDWTENSVFQGALTDGVCKELISRLEALIDHENEVIHIFRIDQLRSTKVLGKEKRQTGNVVL